MVIGRRIMHGLRLHTQGIGSHSLQPMSLERRKHRLPANHGRVCSMYYPHAFCLTLRALIMTPLIGSEVDRRSPCKADRRLLQSYTYVRASALLLQSIFLAFLVFKRPTVPFNIASFSSSSREIDRSNNVNHVESTTASLPGPVPPRLIRSRHPSRP